LVGKGSRLLLVLSAADSIQFEKIQYEKNYNSGGVVADETIAVSRPVTVALFHDAKHRSALYVPVAAAETTAETQ
jgi:hypothetical protein